MQPAEFVQGLSCDIGSQFSDMSRLVVGRYEDSILVAFRELHKKNTAVGGTSEVIGLLAMSTGQKWRFRNPFLEMFVLCEQARRDQSWSVVAHRELLMALSDTPMSEGRLYMAQSELEQATIAIECDGYLPLPDAKQLTGCYCPLTPRQCDEIPKVLASGLSRLDENKGFSNLFWAGTRMVSIRQDLSSDRVYSASFRALPGLSVIYIPSETHTVGEDDLLDALVHESVHGMIYAFEATFERIVHPGRTRDGSLTLTSPWTGQQLGIDSAVQACLVWAVLAQLWGSLNPTHKLRKRALRGFESPHYARYLIGLRDCLRPGVAEVLSTIPGLLSAVAIPIL
jgi:hypothetical protein